MRVSFLVAAVDVQTGILLFADQQGSPMPWLKKYFQTGAGEAERAEEGVGGSGGAQ